MIYYNKILFFNTLFKNINNLFKLECFYFALYSMILCYIFVLCNKFNNGFKLEDHIQGFNLTLNVFSFFLATTLSFRLNSAFNKWNDSFTQVSDLISKSTQFLNILFSSKDANRQQYILNNIKESITYYIGIIFCICSEVYNGKTDKYGIREHFLKGELLLQFEHYKNMFDYNLNNNNVIEKDILELNLPSTYILNIIEANIRIDLKNLQEIKHINDLQLINLNAFFTKITNIANNIYTIGNIPIVHIYNQFTNFIIITYVTIFSINMAAIEGYYSGLFVFVWSYIIFIANNVANQINTPFGDEQNDIELEIIYKNYKYEIDILYDQIIIKNNIDKFIY